MSYYAVSSVRFSRESCEGRLFDGIFHWFFVRYLDKCYFRVLYARIYKTDIFTLKYFLCTMAVAYVVFIDDIAMF